MESTSSQSLSASSPPTRSTASLQPELVEDDHDFRILGHRFHARPQEDIAQGAGRQVRALGQEQDIVQAGPRDFAVTTIPDPRRRAKQRDLRRVVLARDQPAAPRPISRLRFSMSTRDLSEDSSVTFS